MPTLISQWTDSIYLTSQWADEGITLNQSNCLRCFIHAQDKTNVLYHQPWEPREQTQKHKSPHRGMGLESTRPTNIAVNTKEGLMLWRMELAESFPFLWNRCIYFSYFPFAIIAASHPRPWSYTPTSCLWIRIQIGFGFGYQNRLIVYEVQPPAYVSPSVFCLGKKELQRGHEADSIYYFHWEY